MKRSRQVWETPGPGLMDNHCDFSQNFKLHSSAPSYAHGVNRTRLQTYDCHSGLPTFAGACLEFYLDPTQEMYLFHDSLVYLDLQVVKIKDDGLTAHLKTDDDSRGAPSTCCTRPSPLYMLHKRMLQRDPSSPSPLNQVAQGNCNFS